MSKFIEFTTVRTGWSVYICAEGVSAVKRGGVFIEEGTDTGKRTDCTMIHCGSFSQSVTESVEEVLKALEAK